MLWTGIPWSFFASKVQVIRDRNCDNHLVFSKYSCHEIENSILLLVVESNVQWTNKVYMYFVDK